MRTFDKSSLLEEELNDLRMRFELCEADKKAFFETSQWTLKQNKEDITKLKSFNKQLSEEINGLKKYDLDMDKLKTRPTTNVAEKLDQKIIDLQKRLDDLRVQKKTREDYIRELEDRHELAKKEERTIKAEKDSDESKDMSILENKLDKVNIKQNEATTLRKIYEQLVKVLSEERQQFDHQLAIFGKTLKQKRIDAQELEEMSKEAEKAKDNAKHELSRFEMRVLEERKQREKEISRLKDIIKHRKHFDDKFERKLAKQPELPLSPDADQSSTTDSDSSSALTQMNETLQLIKTNTGFSDVKDVVAKMKELQNTQEHLANLKRQYEARLEELKQRKKDLGSAHEASQKSDGTSDESNEKVEILRAKLEQKQKSLNDVNADLQEISQKNEKLLKFQRNALFGIKQLHEKLGGISTEEEVDIRVSSNNLPTAMEICQKKMAFLVKTLKEKEESEGSIPLPPISVTQAVLPSNNVRIQPTPVPESVDDNMSEELNEYEVPDRETLKRYTNQMISARLKGKQGGKKKKRSKREDDNE